MSFSADGLHRLLHMSPICPFRRMVCTGVYTCPPRVLFGGWSAQAFTQFSYLSFSADGLLFSYLSFSADGLHRPLRFSLTCPFHAFRLDASLDRGMVVLKNTVVAPWRLGAHSPQEGEMGENEGK